MSRHRPIVPARSRALVLALAACALALAVAVPLAPLSIQATQLPWMLQAAAQAVAAVACARAARGADGPARRAWILLAAGQALWSLTSISYAVVTGLGVEVPEVSAFDVAWLAYYLPTLAAVGVFYHLMQPEPGWLGAIDAFVLTAGAAVIVWALVLTPIAAAGDGGTLGTLVNGLYPGLDLLGLCVVGWLTIRRRATPRWTLALSAFFGLSVAGGVLYLDAALSEAPVADGLSGVLYGASSLALATAADARRTGGPQAGATRHEATTPPAWSQLLLPALAVPMALMLLDRSDGPADVLALGILLVVVGRLSWSLLVLARMGQAHEALLRRDPLTGAHNRRFLSEELGRLTARALRSGEPLAAVALDLDGFKVLNDTHGHAAGDAFLVRTVSEMRVRLRSGDVLCRLGGDEFVVLLPDTGEEGALRLARRMLDAVTATRGAMGAGVSVNGSLGVVAAYGSTGFRALLHRADAAMYAAKGAGGGRVVVWHEDLPTAGDRARAVVAPPD